MKQRIGSLEKALVCERILQVLLIEHCDRDFVTLSSFFKCQSGSVVLSQTLGFIPTTARLFTSYFNNDTMWPLFNQATVPYPCLPSLVGSYPCNKGYRSVSLFKCQSRNSLRFSKTYVTFLLLLFTSHFKNDPFCHIAW